MDVKEECWTSWLNYRNSYNQYGVAKSIIDKLDTAAKIWLFKKAIQEEQEGLVLNYILATRELNSEEYYDIIKELYNYLFSTATFPGEYSPIGRGILVDLVNHVSNYREKISDDCEKCLIKADLEDDDEVVLLIGNLLYDIKSDQYPSFIIFCKKSKHQSIRGVLELFED